MRKLHSNEKQKAWSAGTKSLKFIKDLKRHVQIAEGFTAHRAAYALVLLEEYINGEFLKKVQEFTFNETES